MVVWNETELTGIYVFISAWKNITQNIEIKKISILLFITSYFTIRLSFLLFLFNIFVTLHLQQKKLLELILLNGIDQ